MTNGKFDAWVGIDWSGARGSYDGIAVAVAGGGRVAPRLVPSPEGPRWTRSQVQDWLRAQASSDGRVLVGIDCAFALPAAGAAGWFAGDYDVFALWDRIEAVCAGDPDFQGGRFAEDPAHNGAFWQAGTRPAGYVEPHRATENACAAAGLGAPQSPFKLIGPKQVGKGALAGMRVLRALKVALGDAFAVWPFEAPLVATARVVAVEIYPRLFLRRCGQGNLKVRDSATLDRCLTALGSAPLSLDRDPDDHEADALVSAAGLRLLSADAATWSPAGLDALARRAEGWIFGVP